MDGCAGIVIKARGRQVSSHPCQERKGGAASESEYEKAGPSLPCFPQPSTTVAKKIDTCLNLYPLREEAIAA